ncbi:MAG: hypothetical protein ACREAN_03835, partial [Nitrosopumilaceae archaeon]
SWDIPAAKSGWIPIEKPVIMAILDKLDEKTIIEIAQMVGKKITEETTLTMTGDFDVSELVSVMELRSKAAGFQFDKFRDANIIKFVIGHQTGRKYSIFLQSFYENGFKQLGCPVEFKITENIMVCQIPTRHLDGD